MIEERLVRDKTGDRHDLPARQFAQSFAYFMKVGDTVEQAQRIDAVEVTVMGKPRCELCLTVTEGAPHLLIFRRIVILLFDGKIRLAGMIVAAQPLCCTFTGIGLNTDGHEFLLDSHSDIQNTPRNRVNLTLLPQ